MTKMKPELIGIAFSDLHSYKFKLFDKDNSRLEWSLKALTYIANIAQQNRVPLLFAGDLFHTPVSVENETLTKTITYYKRYIEDRKISCYAISGNHDMSQKNGIDHFAPSYLETFAEVFGHFYLLDHHDKPFRVTRSSDALIWGIPYMNNDTELRERIKELRKKAKRMTGFKILLMHGDCPGAKDSGIEIKENKALGEKKDLKILFAPWDLVLFGHIHHPQKITDKCYMLGSPIHQTSGESVQMGYWKIFIGKEPEFIGLVDFPKFRKLGKGEKPDNDLDYFIPYEEIGKIEEIEAGDFDLSNSRTKLAKRYSKVKKIKDPEKRKALIKALNEVE